MLNSIHRRIAPFVRSLFVWYSERLAPPAFRREFQQGLRHFHSERRGFEVMRVFRYDAGEHPADYADYECLFAADQLHRERPSRVLDVGSYRKFVLGLLASYHVTTLDVRPRDVVGENETAVTGDAKDLVFSSDSFDAVVSLCSIEHFGLGRYGDALDTVADLKALSELKRVVRPGGLLVLTTTVTGGGPFISFNCHRVYDMRMISEMRGAWEVVEERLFSRKLTRFCPVEELVNDAPEWDVYCGAWRKPDESA